MCLCLLLHVGSKVAVGGGNEGSRLQRPYWFLKEGEKKKKKFSTTTKYETKQKTKTKLKPTRSMGGYTGLVADFVRLRLGLHLAHKAKKFLGVRHRKHIHITSLFRKVTAVSRAHSTASRSA